MMHHELIARSVIGVNWFTERTLVMSQLPMGRLCEAGSWQGYLESNVSKGRAVPFQFHAGAANVAVKGSF